MFEVVAFVLRRFGCVLPCLAGACILMCCLPPNLWGFLLAAKVSCLDFGLLVAALLLMHAFDSWLASHGWDGTAEWKWTRSDSGCRLDLSSAGDIGQRQHVVRDAWRTWCLRRHIASERRDAQLHCFHDAAGYFRRIGWPATRKFAASYAEARTLACGATFSPAALGGRMLHRPSTMCIWDGCTELGTFDHIAWGCPRRPCNIPKPAEFLSPRYSHSRYKSSL